MQAQMFKHSDWLNITDVKLLTVRFDKLLHDAGFKILSFNQNHFDPVGFTCVWVLAESHFAIHTFPEEGKSYIELSSCNWRYFVTFVELFNSNG